MWEGKAEGRRELAESAEGAERGREKDSHAKARSHEGRKRFNHETHEIHEFSQCALRENERFTTETRRRGSRKDEAEQEFFHTLW